MIIEEIPSIAPYGLRPLRRIREEVEGGQAFYPLSGKVLPLSEGELVHARSEAMTNPGILYYATRQWSDQPLAEGCCSSPNRIYLELTQMCTLSCAMCYKAAGKQAQGELDTDEMKELIGHLAIIGFHELRLTGGEPTMRSDFLQILDHALALGFYVSLGTNGVWPDHLVEQILPRPIGRFLISLKGIRPINDALRGEGAFDQALRTIDRLVAAGKSVRINTILSRSTGKHLPELAALCKAHGIRCMAVIPPRPVGRANGTSFGREMPGHAEMEKVARMIESLAQQYAVEIGFQYALYRRITSGQRSAPVIRKVVSCPAGREAVFISPDGWFYACGCSSGWSMDPAERAPFAAGNVRSMTAKDIWQLWQCAYVWAPFRDLSSSKDSAYFRCPHYRQGCFGSCPVHAFVTSGSFSGPDPMCWVRDKFVAR